jgi:hypothetical protein
MKYAINAAFALTLLHIIVYAITGWTPIVGPIHGGRAMLITGIHLFAIAGPFVLADIEGYK